MNRTYLLYSTGLRLVDLNGNLVHFMHSATVLAVKQHTVSEYVPKVTDHPDKNKNCNDKNTIVWVSQEQDT